MSRNISISHSKTDPCGGAALATDADITWLVLYKDQQACLHQTLASTDESSLNGPIVFCCKKGFLIFRRYFSDHDCLNENSIKGDPTQDVLRVISAGQIISWLDAGIQVIHFVICDNQSDYGISGAVLSGKQARQALIKELPLEPFLSRSTLNSIGISQKEL